MNGGGSGPGVDKVCVGSGEEAMCLEVGEDTSDSWEREDLERFFF